MHEGELVIVSRTVDLRYSCVHLSAFFMPKIIRVLITDTSVSKSHLWVLDYSLDILLFLPTVTVISEISSLVWQMHTVELFAENNQHLRHGLKDCAIHYTSLADAKVSVQQQCVYEGL